MERITTQRRAIRRVLEEAPGPLGPMEVLETATAEGVRLGLATVYRTIRWLLDAGEVTAVDLPGEPARYEPATRSHHHHFRCTRCGRVIDIPCTVRALETMVPSGYTLEAHEIFLSGTCDRHGR
ncbi:MAG TPA: transcriptional repressor [Gemmatimonadales bacterium]|nr:transcriptional repressor [Gemmatimonadales bacterium]